LKKCCLLAFLGVGVNLEVKEKQTIADSQEKGNQDGE